MRTRETLCVLIGGLLSSRDGWSERVWLVTFLISEEALKAETRDALGRDDDERGAENGPAWRHRHRTGPIVFSAP